MKSINIFKKEKKRNLAIKQLEKNQLAKIIGGSGESYDTTSVSSNEVLKTRHDTVKNSIGNIR